MVRPETARTSAALPVFHTIEKVPGEVPVLGTMIGTLCSVK